MLLIDIDTRVPIGPYADVFKSYLGMLAWERISILTPSFDHVTEVDRNMIWHDLLVTNINVIKLLVWFYLWYVKY